MKTLIELGAQLAEAKRAENAAAQDCYAFFRTLRAGIARDLKAPPYETTQDAEQTHKGEWFRRDLLFTIDPADVPLRVPLFARKAEDGTYHVRVADCDEVAVVEPEAPGEVSQLVSEEIERRIDKKFFHPE